MSMIISKALPKTATINPCSRIPLRPLLPKHQEKQGRPQSKSAPATINVEKCGKKREHWANEVMVAVMKSVTDENTPILQAARMHGISKSTLHDHISENVTHDDKPGPDQLLSPAEEEELSNFLIRIAQAGYRKTRKEIRNITGRVAVDKKRRKTPDISHGWFQRFMQRYLHLSYQKGDSIANVRMNCLSKEVISDYFH